MAYSVGPSMRVKVLYPYDTGIEDELTIKPGDEIEVSREEWDSNNKWIKGIIVLNSQKTRVKPKYFFKPLTVEVKPVKPKELPPSQDKGTIETAFKGQKYHLAEKPVEDWLECIICTELPEEPQLTKCCVKTMCQKCIQKCKDKKQNCPNCRKNGFQYSEDLRAKQRIHTLMTHCPNDRCNWKGFLKDVNRHLATCQWQMVCCDQCKETKVLKAHLESHKVEECQYRRVACPMCKAKREYNIFKIIKLNIFASLKNGAHGFFTYHEIITNHYKECREWPCRCPNRCDSQLCLTNQTLEAHLSNDCPEQAIACQFESVQCKEMIKRKNMKQHLNEKMADHLSLLMKDHAKLMSEHLQLKQKVTELKK